MRVQPCGRLTVLPIRPRRLSMLAVAIVAGSAPAAFCQGVGGNTPTDTTHDLSLLVGLPGSSEPPVTYCADTGRRTDPIRVSLDLLGPAWAVHLYRSSGVRSGAPIVLTQYLRISGSYSWNRWRMDLDTPDVRWQISDEGFGVLRLLADGTLPPGYRAEQVDNSVLFSFDPLPPGTLIQISSKMIYIGSERLESPIDIRQYPVPEGVSSLTAVLLSVAAARGRRPRMAGSAAS